MKPHPTLEELVRAALERYLRDLDDQTPTHLYDMVLKAIERPMFELIMTHAGQNQSRAAEMLGLNRNTLRKKLDEYDLR